MLGIDTLKIEILADGTIRTVTDPVSKPNHDSADQFLKAIDTLAGGEVIITAREGAHKHTHEHHEKAGEHVRQ